MLPTQYLTTRKRIARQFEAPADNGFFGPGSMTWKVWSYPSSYILGFTRSVTIEHLDPNLAAAVDQSGGVKYRPNTRYSRTMAYFALVAFGATEPTAKASDVLVKVHSKAIGHDPVTGGEYDANKPSSQLWIHMTAWHSILLCYERFGPGRLTTDEENQYWAECARAAELQTIDPATVPASRDEVRAYFDEWRPHLATSETANDLAHFILQLDVALPPKMPQWQKQLMAPALYVMRKGVIATYPRHMKQLFGLRQSRVADVIYTQLNKTMNAIAYRSPAITFTLMDMMAPAAMATAAPVILDIPARSQETMTPREAQTKYGYDLPEVAHEDLRAKQRKRVFGEGEKPSDEGLLESQHHIGAIA